MVAITNMSVYFFSFVLTLSLFILIYRNHIYQQRLVNSENKYRTLIENIKHSYFFYSHNEDGVFTYVSDSIYSILGYENVEFLVHYENFLTNHPLNQNIKSYSKKILRGIIQPPYKLEVYHKDGSKHWLEVTETPKFNAQGELVSIDGIAKDITDEIRVDRLIENSETILFYWEAKDNWPVAYVSKNISIFGYCDEDFLSGKISFSSIIHPDDVKEVSDEVKYYTKDCIDSFFQIYRIIDADGNIRWIDDRTTIERNAQGEALFYLGTILDITEQKNAEIKLIHQAKHDELTNLPNRTLFLDRLTTAIEQAEYKKSQFGVIFVDFDRFKEVNDSMGHKFGDKIILEASNRFNECMRNINTLSRLGGDEFVFLTDKIDDIANLIEIVDKLSKVMERPFFINKQYIYLTLSIGISIYPQDGKNAGVLLKNSDAAMFKAKDDGRNTYRFYTKDMTTKALAHIAMEANMRKGLEREEFVVHYQPQVDGITGKLIGMEALVRWQDPIRGLIPPYKFIPLAETTGLIIPLDRWVMKTAMLQMVEWYNKGFNAGILALNLSIQQLQKPDFIYMLDNLIELTKIKPEWIELEVTEGQIMKNPKEAIEVLNQISERGIELAIDDFGTGYSSLAYLKKFPINKLKIDQSFIKDIPIDENDRAITRAIISLSQNLNLNIIAEGVETLDQKDFLIKNGCKNIQGYLYAKPIDAESIERLWLKHQ